MTVVCPTCARGHDGTPVPPVRSPYCSTACWFGVGPRPTPAPSRHDGVTMTCPVCERRCGECMTFMRRAGIGGSCPCCDEPVAIAELVGEEVIAGS